MKFICLCIVHLVVSCHTKPSQFYLRLDKLCKREHFNRGQTVADSTASAVERDANEKFNDITMNDIWFSTAILFS